jgi:hypothetical protein
VKLWHLRRTDKVDYDEYDSFVVRAETEQEARELLINEHARDNYFNPWTRVHADVVCAELTMDGPTEIILGSFNAG